MKEKINYGIVAFVAFIFGGLVMYYFSINNTLKKEKNKEVPKVNDTVIIDNSSISTAVSKIYDSVVLVNAYKGSNLSNTGSGFVYRVDDKYGYVMTNQHVIENGNRITLIFSDDKEIDAKVLGSDEYLDLAVMQIDRDAVKSIANIGKDSECKLGDNVFTVGSPLGYDYRGTITNGIVSGLNRLVEVSVNSSKDDWVMKVIQTNAAVNPGNSGGPLVNSNGEVIGIVSLKLVQDSVEGMGFAIPIEYAMSHIDILESGKKIERPLLGIGMFNIDEADLFKSQYGIEVDESITKGVVVIEITKDSNASKSTLKKGDIITKLNGEDVDNAAYLKYLLYRYNVGDSVKITYFRDGKYHTTDITLAKSK